MSKNLVAQQLADLNVTPTSVQPGFKKFYLKNGSLKLYDGVESDVVLDRVLEEFEAGNAAAITADDTVLEAFKKIGNSFSTLQLTGKVTGTAAYTSGTLAIETEFTGEFDKNYIHDQLSASSIWTVTHNLNKFPSVSVVDSANTTVIGDIQHLDVNTTIITFTSSFSGKAIFN